MAACSWPSLPRSPVSYAMNVNAALPSLPTEILSTWATWRYPKHEPLTPPSSGPLRRLSKFHSHTTTLPPIESFDRESPCEYLHCTPRTLAYNSYAVPPLSTFETASSYAHDVPPRLPPVDISRVPTYEPEPPHPQPLTPSPTPSPRVSDWFTESRHWSPNLLAEKTCEMICYLWFSKSSNSSPVSTHSPPLSYFPHRNSKTAWLQFSVSSVFVHFMQKLLQTTQLSQSVIVLSLHYVYRLKERNSVTIPQPGSEFRVAVAALMMANKFVDDNTYTNKTWSEVSGIELTEVNKMEREFLEGIDFGLYVDKQTYDAWVNLLKGLVMAKEKDSRYWKRSRQAPRAAAVSRPSVPPLSVPSRRSTVRARSTSPNHFTRPANSSSFTFAPVQPTYSPEVYMDADSAMRSRSKRSAMDAFSPTSASFDSARPAKKPTGLALEIPETIGSGMHTPSPLEGLQFSKLSLASSPAPPCSADSQNSYSVGSSRRVSPQTLVAAYRLDPTKPRAAPQNLYFYSLAGSPLAEDSRTHKGRLRYHQPPAPSAPSHYAYQTQHSQPYVVQSASASPNDPSRMTAQPPYPHAQDSAWSHAPVQHDTYFSRPCTQEPVHRAAESAALSAPFANAGPPGVHYYPTPAPHRSSPEDYWRRGRRL
ncbi:hypothetical protein BV25DRAFT_1915551 [Artomyces pyxidatus]|uniref:Uncharacterized protein n=1 Tax=Artomyces pyxidatus TaxID=48021 RepID=A0ACB8T5F7_9AGAM|nr:hypothetical protein BV25DRAFT_1915551 [Artomyces pyxidatus]